MNLVNQAIILGAGECSRFYPFTRRQHKSDFILLDRPIIARTIDALRSLGITKIEVIESPDDDQSLEKTFSLYASDLSVRFWIQQKPLGTGHAILQAKDVAEDRFLVINPQQLNLWEHINTLIKNFSQFLDNPQNLILFSKETTNPQRYGMFYLDGQKVTGLIEKPTSLTGLSSQRNMGVYLLTKDFLNFMDTTPTTDFQLIEALNSYVQNHPAFAVPTTASGLTLKYATDLFPIQKYLLQAESKDNIYIHPTATVDPTATLIAPLSIESDSIISPHVTLTNCIVGQNTTIGEHSVISDSIIGNNCIIGENLNTLTSNPDSSNIFITVKDKSVDTGLKNLGVLMGDHSSLMSDSSPGEIIPESLEKSSKS